jgi:hypothetical protein
MRILSRHRHRLIARVLALALLVAQLGAEAHAYSHLVTDQRGAPNSAQTCGKCLSFAPLTMAVGGAPYVVLTDRCEAERVVPIAISSIPNRSPYSAHRPRGPPQLL